ncbi:MAG: GDSL-type esterase/lipase family protein [Pirellulales bacterium]
MNCSKLLLLLLLVPFAASSLPAADSGELVPAQECRPRGGVPRFLEKTQRNAGELRVAYLGGSITAQPGWRLLSLEFLRTQFPGVKFSEVNAAIGGTGSDLGVFRLQQDVLDHQPDLLFVEFAVNDGGAAPDQIVRSMEGIVRQTRRTLPGADVVFVYTITEALVPPLLEGKFPRAASVMERVADHYQIPTIHLGMEVARLAKDGKLAWKAPLPKTDEQRKQLGDVLVFAPDGVHPHVETGHRLYLEAIERSWPAIQTASTSTVDRPLVEPLDSNNYERAQLIPFSRLNPPADFERLDPVADPFGRRWAIRMTSLHRATKPGTTLTFRFRGTHAAIYDLLGPDCGQVIVTLDDRPPRIVPRFDSYCTYHRLATLQIGADLPDAEHTVRIELHPDQPDKAAILATRNNHIDDPARYNGTAFYPGALLVIGDLCP